VKLNIKAFAITAMHLVDHIFRRRDRASHRDWRGLPGLQYQPHRQLYRLGLGID